MKKTNLAIMIIFLLFFIFSCADSGSEKSAAQTASDAALPTISPLQIITGTATGAWIKIGAGIAEKSNESFTGFPINAIPGPGSIGNPAIVSVGDADFGMSYGPFLINAQAGNAPYEDSFTNLRAIASLTPTVAHFLADHSLGVTTVKELIDNNSGITLGCQPQGGGSAYITSIIFSAMGYAKLDDFEAGGGTIYYASGSNLIDAWKDRHVDAVTSAFNVPSAAIDESLIGRPGTVLSMGEQLLDLLTSRYGFLPYTIEAETYTGQQESALTVALPIVLFTRDDVADETVYALAKAIFDNTEYLKTIHSSFNSYDSFDMAKGLGITAHPGAQKLFDENNLSQ